MASASCHKVIVDCDAGVDDGQAIAMLLAQKHIQIVAITTVFGNEPVESTSRNVVRVLKLCERLDIPVYKGCASPLTIDWPQHYKYDELGKATIPGVDPTDTSCIQPEHASVALCRLVSEDPGSITLLSVAPLTNIAVALMLDPQFGSKLKNCVMMGGNCVGQGNASLSAEHNWHCDPEAAHAVLAGLNKVITLLPQEICLASSFSWEWYKSITELPTKMAYFITIDEKFRLASKDYREKYFAWDQLAAACVIDAAVICEAKSVSASVELHNSDTRGVMLIDVNNAREKRENMSIVTKVNQALYENIITTAFSIV